MARSDRFHELPTKIPSKTGHVHMMDYPIQSLLDDYDAIFEAKMAAKSPLSEVEAEIKDYFDNSYDGVML